MLGRRPPCTGIDLGAGAVTLVRGLDSPSHIRITHIGIEDRDPSSEPDAAATAESLQRLLDRARLAKENLGRLAVGLGGEGVSLREVLLPPMKEDDIRRALPFEAKRHLFLEGMEAPIFDFQVLGTAQPEEEGGAPQTRVLLAAVSKPKRDFVLDVLARLRLEPEVIDLNVLAGLNVLTSNLIATADSNLAVGLLDIGSHESVLCLTHPVGGLLTRVVGSGSPPADAGPGAVDAFVSGLTAGIKETLTYYRGRHRREARKIYLAGGGALLPEMDGRLGERLGMAVSVLDPFCGDLSLTVVGRELAEPAGARFVTALGLCQRFRRERE